jgi:hypothetical protein
MFLAKSKDVTTILNLAESSNEGYGSKRAVLPMMIIIMKWKKMVVTYFKIFSQYILERLKKNTILFVQDWCVCVCVCVCVFRDTNHTFPESEAVA